MRLAPLLALLLAGCGGTTRTVSGHTWDQIWNASQKSLKARMERPVPFEDFELTQDPTHGLLDLRVRDNEFHVPIFQYQVRVQLERKGEDIQLVCRVSKDPADGGSPCMNCLCLPVICLVEIPYNLAPDIFSPEDVGAEESLLGEILKALESPADSTPGPNRTPPPSP